MGSFIEKDRNKNFRFLVKIMKRIEKYVKNIDKLVKAIHKLKLTERGVITGGFCANSYFQPCLRRYSNDIDFLFPENQVPQNFNGPLVLESGSKFYYKQLDRDLYIFLIIEDVDIENYPVEEIGTFNEHFSESGSKIFGKRLKEHEILKTKMEYFISRFRGAEAVKDAYDISLLVNYMDEEIVKEVIEHFGDDISKIASYIISMKKFKDAIKRKIQPLIASGEFPEKIYDNSIEKLEKFAEAYNPDEIIFSATIFSLSRKEVKEILGKMGVESDRTKDLAKILDKRLDEIDYSKKSKLAKEIIHYGKSAVIEVLYEIFDLRD